LKADLALDGAELLLPVCAEAFFGAACPYYSRRGTVLWGPVTFAMSACTVRVCAGALERRKDALSSERQRRERCKGVSLGWITLSLRSLN
jgi:hypothetical protein